MSWQGRSVEEIGDAIVGLSQCTEANETVLRAWFDALSWAAHPTEQLDSKMGIAFRALDKAVEAGRERLREISATN